MKGPAFAALVLWLAAAPASALDYFTLALTWHPALCRRLPQAAGCSPRARKALVLHGLWPEKTGDRQHSFAYCGAAANKRKFEQPGAWCSLPALELSAQASDDLDGSMPGRASCLDRHEWQKHGTCSGLSAENYFSMAHQLTLRFSATKLGRYLSAKAGKTVTAKSLISEFESEFGPGSRAALNFYCRDVGGAVLLNEIKFYLTAGLRPEHPLKSLLARPDAWQRGDCPASFLIAEPNR